MHSVSSWFCDQLAETASSPIRTLTLGGSDYSSRVINWGQIRKTAQDVSPATLQVKLNNTDKHFNSYYTALYTGVNTATIKLGFQDAVTSEHIQIFAGYLKNVRYEKEQVMLTFQDNLWRLAATKIGDSNQASGGGTIVISGQLASDIAWTICTCYSTMSGVTSTSNQHIDYTSWLAWAAVLSADTLLMNARYEGITAGEALSSLMKMSQSACWVEGDGKLKFQKFFEASSLDILLTSEIKDVSIELEDNALINKQWVVGDYRVESDYFAISVNDVNSSSVNSYSLREGYLEDRSCWYVSSATAQNIAQRIVGLYSEPPKKFNLTTDLTPVRMQIADPMRFTDAFMGITSLSAWRITELSVDLNTGETSILTDSVSTLAGFYLDIDDLDSEARLL